MAIVLCTRGEREKAEVGLVPRLFPCTHTIIDDLYPYGYKGHQLLHARVGEPGYKARQRYQYSMYLALTSQCV